ncbi:MAG TPA: hypothetical protein VF097_05405 [Actinomycetota bacterium]
MRDVVRRYVEAGLGTLKPERAEELARELVDWSKRNTERVVAIVQREVKRQLRIAGAATQDELRELRKRVRTLERRLDKAEKPSRSKSSSKSSASKSSTRKQASTRKTSSARRSRPKA